MAIPRYRGHGCR
ncbi:hypothetical protein YPPY01_2853, partial [Yersinia pestis PY-01]